MFYRHFPLVGGQDYTPAPHHCSGQRALCPDSFDSRETCIWASHFTFESVSSEVLYLLRPQALALHILFFSSSLFLGGENEDACEWRKKKLVCTANNNLKLGFLPIVTSSPPQKFLSIPNPGEMWADCTNLSPRSPRQWSYVWRLYVLATILLAFLFFRGVYF